MYLLIETNEQLEELLNQNYKKAFIEIIPYNPFQHPVQNQICAFYIRPLDAIKGFIIPIDHSETLSISIDNIIRVLDNFNSIFVRDKKGFFHYLIFDSLSTIHSTSPPYIPQLTSAHKFLYNKYPNKKDVNRIVPIVKHYEYCEQIYNDLKDEISKPINKFYDNRANLVFNGIERSGIRVDKKTFEKHFHPIEGEYVYTQYNLNTLTKRPSNKFGGVNYAALNKENGCRKSFIPRNDILLEMDLSAYHVVLLGKLIGYDFGDKDIHSEFAEIYGVGYQKAKELTFKQLYGGVFEQYKDLEFFQKVEKYTNKTWDSFQQKGYIECPISKHRYYKNDLKDMNPRKLLSYILQNLETSINVYILWDIFKLLKGKNTKLILTIYDSYLFDYDKDEKGLLEDIQNVFDKYGLSFKMKKGKNYHNME